MTSAAAFPQRHVEHCMGTVFSIDVRAPGVDAAIVAAAVDWLHWVDATFSTYRPTSQISRLARGDIAPADCAPAVTDVLSQCDRLKTVTGGYFDCRAGGVLDPSGYVKGWAIERVSDLLAENGSTNHCVNGGGDVQCHGSAAPGREWRVGVAHPLQPGVLIATCTGSDLAVATSGTAERGSHIIDPRMASAPTALASVTVVGRRLAEVDAYATAAFAMADSAERWLSDAGLLALLVYADGRIRSTSGGQSAGVRVERD